MEFMGERYCTVFVDPSAASFIAALRQRGVYVVEAKNNVFLITVQLSYKYIFLISIKKKAFERMQEGGGLSHTSSKVNKKCRIQKSSPYRVSISACPASGYGWAGCQDFCVYLLSGSSFPEQDQTHVPSRNPFFCTFLHFCPMCPLRD